MKTNLFSRSKYWILARFAKKVIGIHHPFVIGIIGVDGERKLIKNAVYQVLADKFGEDVYTNSNLLGDQEAILAILKYKSNYWWPIILVGGYLKTFMKNYPKFLVLELGEGKLEYLNFFTNVSKLDILVYANTVDGGKNNLSDFENVLKPEGKIFLKSNSGMESPVHEKPLITVSTTNKDADFFATNFTSSKDGTIYRIITRGQNIAIKSKTGQESDLISQLFAFAVGHQFNIQSLKIKKSLEKISE